MRKIRNLYKGIMMTILAVLCCTMAGCGGSHDGIDYSDKAN